MSVIEFTEITDDDIARAEAWAKEDLFRIYEPYNYDDFRTTGDGTKLSLFYAYRTYGPTVDGQEACSAFPREIGEAFYYDKNRSFSCLIAVKKKPYT
jgi:hypothetical protein